MKATYHILASSAEFQARSTWGQPAPRYLAGWERHDAECVALQAALLAVAQFLLMGRGMWRVLVWVLRYNIYEQMVRRSPHRNQRGNECEAREGNAAIVTGALVHSEKTVIWSC